jgi:hypothetical protein
MRPVQESAVHPAPAGARDGLAAHDATVAAHCRALHADRDRAKGRSGVRRRPERIAPD